MREIRKGEEGERDKERRGGEERWGGGGGRKEGREGGRK